MVPLTKVSLEASPGGEVGRVTVTQVPLTNLQHRIYTDPPVPTDHVGGVPCSPEVLGQQAQGTVETVRLEPLYGPPLQAHPPGVQPRQEGRPAGGTLGGHVGLAQHHSGPRQHL